MTEIVDSRALRRHIEKCVGDLPAMPNVVARVVALTDDPASTAAELQEVVATDQALTAKVIRVVNSAYYGLNPGVTSIRHAVQILGMRHLRNLTLSLAAMSLVKARAPHMVEHQNDFWRHSLGVGVAAAAIAERAKQRRDVVDDVLTGGLLHDLGRLFLLGYFFELFRRTMERSLGDGVPICTAEQGLMGIDHAEIGMLMARHWDFPEVLVTMIQHHHGPVPTNEYYPHVASVHLADCLMLRLDEGRFATDTPPDPSAVSWADLTAEAGDALIEEVRLKMARAEEMLGLNSVA
jgi:putative nucleotidyltransferase with HDIG domain